MFRQEERCNEKKRPLHRGIFQKCTAHRYSEMNEKATIRWKNIAGQHFGKLTALDTTENRYDGSVA